MKERINTDRKNGLALMLILSTLYLLLATSICGCEAFQRKFVRKPKQEKEVAVVVQTKEYSAQGSIKETYKKYYLFWHAADDELINLLNNEDLNHKKVVSLAKRISENLQQMRQLLQPGKQERLDVFILEQNGICAQLDAHSLSRAQRLQIQATLEKQKRQLEKEFVFKHIQEYLIRE